MFTIKVKVKRIISFLLVFQMLFLSACSTKKADEEKIKRILSQKYGGNFDIINLFNQSFGNKWFEADVCSTEYPNVPFRVSVDSKDDNFSDDFVEKIICYKISSAIQENIKGIADNYFVHTHTFGFQKDFEDQNISIQEFIEENNDNTTFGLTQEIYIPENNFIPEQGYESLCNTFKDIEYIPANVILIFVDDSKLDIVKQYLTTHSSKDLDFSKNIIPPQTPTIRAPFENGKIAMDKTKFMEDYEKLSKNK